MKRRDRQRNAGIPEELARFVASEWPGACLHEQVRAWSVACQEWLDEPGRALPFGEHGDVVDVLREEWRIRSQVPPCPHEYRPAQYQGPAS
jgi:hypothetical protein